MSRNYKLHFRQSDFSILFTDLILSANYGVIDYRILNYNNCISGYLTLKGQRQASKIGDKLNNSLFTKKLFSKFKRFEKLINNKKLQNEIIKLQKIDLYKSLILLEKLFIKFCNLYFYCEQPVLINLENKILANNIDSKQLIKALSDIKHAQKKFLKHDVMLIILLNKIGRYKLKLHKKIEPWFKLFNSLIQLIALEYNMSLQQVGCLRVKELKDLITKEQIKNIDDINNRIKGSVFLPPLKKQKDWRLLTGKSFIIWKKKLMKSNRYVTGHPVYAGKAIGKVVVHLDWLKLKRIPKGTVLVAGMTNPQIIPLLRNAVAIVTDEGGLTCHAAIVSRELKIPCIVGTGNATQVFKNGDKVEVDANKGIVRKI